MKLIYGINFGGIHRKLLSESRQNFRSERKFKVIVATERSNKNSIEVRTDGRTDGRAA